MNQDIYSVVDQILVPHTALQQAIMRIEQCFNAAQSSSDPFGLSMIGESRTGKTRAQEHIARKHPRQRTDDGLRVPILRVRTPSKPSVKGLAEVMLRSLGDPRADKGTETNMTNRLNTLLRATQCRMIMLDEFQHFYDRQSHKVMHHVADWLKLVVDESTVALVVSGLPSCQAVLNQNEQLAGRFLAPIRMPRFDWENDDLRDEFIGILGAFQEGLHQFELPNLSSDEMAFRFYCATGGLIGYIVKILRQGVWNAADAFTRCITIEDLARAHRESVYLDEKAGDLPPAFDRGFVVRANEALLQRARSIGTAVPEEPRSRNRGRSKKEASE